MPLQGPTDEQRERFGARIFELDSEDALEGLLDEIIDELQQDVADNFSNEPEDDLFAAVEAWAGLVSHPIAYFYAPSSPWPRNLAGWSTRVTARIQKAVAVLLKPLRAAQKAMGATSVSISANFPWGISVGFTW